MAQNVRFTSSFGLGKLHALFEELLGAKAAKRIFVEQDLPLGVTRVKTVKVLQRDVLGLHERAARAAGDELFGLKIGQRMHPEDFGQFARYAVQAPDLSHMFSRFQRGLRHHQNGAVVQATHHGDFVRWSYRLIEPSSIGRRHHANHCLVLFIESIKRFLGDTWRPLAIELEADRGPGASSVEDFFQTPVYFGCQANALIVDPAALPYENQRTTPIEKRLTIFDLHRTAADRLPETFTDQVRALVSLRLMDRRTDIEGVAAKMGVSVRSLQRGLAAEGLSYRAIVDAVRRQRSFELLAEGTNSVFDIAAALGYSDDAHFIRAFRRWEGRAPKSAWSASGMRS